MHQLAENTVDGWSGVIADLAAKRQAARDHTERLRAQKQELARARLVSPHQVQEPVDDCILRTAGLEGRGSDFVADLLESGVVGKVPARSISVGHHDGVAER